MCMNSRSLVDGDIVKAMEPLDEGFGFCSQAKLLSSFCFLVQGSVRKHIPVAMPFLPCCPVPQTVSGCKSLIP